MLPLLFLLAGGAQSLRHLGSSEAGVRIFRPLWEFPLKTPEKCGTYKHEDLFKPIAQVKRENPGVHMYCYFDGASNLPETIPWAGKWLAWNIHSPPEYNFKLKGYSSRPDCRFKPGQGPFESQIYEGKNVSHHADCGDYPIDDLYFYSLGFMQNMLDGSALIAENWTAWEEETERQCQKLMDKYHFTEEEITVAHLALRNGPDMCDPSVASWKGVGSPPPPREFAKHFYDKCAMDHAAWELSYAYNRACLLPGNIIGHSTECPFPYRSEDLQKMKTAADALTKPQLGVVDDTKEALRTKHLADEFKNK